MGLRPKPHQRVVTLWNPDVTKAMRLLSFISFYLLSGGTTSRFTICSMVQSMPAFRQTKYRRTMDESCASALSSAEALPPPSTGNSIILVLPSRSASPGRYSDRSLPSAYSGIARASCRTSSGASSREVCAETGAAAAQKARTAADSAANKVHRFSVAACVPASTPEAHAHARL